MKDEDFLNVPDCVLDPNGALYSNKWYMRRKRKAQDRQAKERRHNSVFFDVDDLVKETPKKPTFCFQCGMSFSEDTKKYKNWETNKYFCSNKCYKENLKNP